ncbi:capsule biosynthesis phosphatase [Belnapia rosea]|uniref:Capsule biosynthesis phosphatase n=2 Tax=Belnapia rosea TaxID=938405 RepID=A0A1G6Z9A2_9PROT|nr:capsule biosynthesis phosphatase [Belnapia rosea]
MYPAGMKRLVVDLDGTLTIDEPGVPYEAKRPNEALVARLRDYRAAGFEIVVATARNMRTHANNIGRINARTLPVILDWLTRHDIPFDEVHVGKPWCGTEGFYIDDKAVRPSEFLALGYEGVLALLAREGQSDGGA